MPNRTTKSFLLSRLNRRKRHREVKYGEDEQKLCSYKVHLIPLERQSVISKQLQLRWDFRVCSLKVEYLVSSALTSGNWMRY